LGRNYQSRSCEEIRREGEVGRIITFVGGRASKWGKSIEVKEEKE
jgi:hypothetical protein